MKFGILVLQDSGFCKAFQGLIVALDTKPVDFEVRFLKLWFHAQFNPESLTHTSKVFKGLQMDFGYQQQVRSQAEKAMSHDASVPIF